MLKLHRKILLKNRLDLVRDMEPNNLTSYLYQSDVLSENDVELIQSERTRKERAERLLDTLPRKGPKAFNSFVESLKLENGSKHLAELLLSDPEMPDATDAGPGAGKKMEPKKSKETTTASDVYPLTHRSPGMCIIINNKSFTNNLPERTGTDVDARNLQDLFSSLNFNVRVINNASDDSMKHAMMELSEMDHSTTDCLIVFLLSHGISGKIYSSDGALLDVSELLKPLIMCGSDSKLINKPRLFFIQACRVTEDLYKNTHENKLKSKHNASFEVFVHKESHLITETQGTNRASQMFIKESTMPMQANVLLAYSTLPGEASWRNSERGSWFIEALVDVFRSYASKEDVVSMLVRVNSEVATRATTNAMAKQVPAPLITLTKKLYLTHGH